MFDPANPNRRHAFVTPILIVLVLLAVAPHADSSTLQLDRVPITVRFEPDDERVARRVAELCEAEIGRLAAEQGLADVAPIDVVVTGDLSPFRQRFGASLPRWGIAFALMSEQVMVVDVARATNAFNRLEDVVPHELSHLLLAQRVGPARMPIWFVEGLAQWQAGEWSLMDGWLLMNAVWGGNTPKLWQLTSRYPDGERKAQDAYRVSYAGFTGVFEQRWDDLPRFLDRVATLRDFDAAFAEFFGEDVMAYGMRFHDELDRRYHSRLLFFQPAPLFGLFAVVFLLLIFRYYVYKRRKMRQLERQDRGLSLDDDEHPVI